MRRKALLCRALRSIVSCSCAALSEAVASTRLRRDLSLRHLQGFPTSVLLCHKSEVYSGHAHTVCQCGLFQPRTESKLVQRVCKLRRKAQSALAVCLSSRVTLCRGGHRADAHRTARSAVSVGVFASCVRHGCAAEGCGEDAPSGRYCAPGHSFRRPRRLPPA